MGNALQRKVLCCFLGSLLLLQKQVAADHRGEFHESPQDVIVKAGECVTLTCRIKHIGEHSPILWNFQRPNDKVIPIGVKQWPNKGSIFPPFKSRFSWTDKNNSTPLDDNPYRIYDLRIANITAQDGGNYTCIRRAYSMRSALVEVIEGNNEITVKQGESVRLACRVADRHNTVSWWLISKKDGVHQITAKFRWEWKNDKKTKYSTRVNYIGGLNLGDYDILISNVQKSDRGVYRCQSLIWGKTVLTIHLKVLWDEEPVFTVLPHDTYGMISKDVTLKCKASPVNDAGVIGRWKRSNNQRRLNPMIVSNFKHNDTGHIRRYKWTFDNPRVFDIILLSVKKSDEGYYWCEVLANPYDVFDEPIMAGATLRVFGKPPGSINGYVPTLWRSSLRKETTNKVYLHCVANHKLIWLDEDFNILTDGTERVTDDHSIGISLNSDFPDSLEIRFLEPKHAQKYYCVLAGDTFVWESEVLLVVQGCPLWHSSGSWAYNTKSDICYGTNPARKLSFGGAGRFCRQINAKLAMPKSVEQTQNLEKSGKQITGPFSQKMWVGLDAIEWEDRWKLIDGSMFSEEVASWALFSPQDNKNLNCALLDNRLVLKDERCDKINDFLCEYPRIHWNRYKIKEKQKCPDGWTSFDCGELCYWKSDEIVTLNEASVACEKKSASLVIMKSMRQWRAVSLMLDVDPNKNPSESLEQEGWIGLKRVEYLLEWNDGTLQHPFLNRFPWGRHYVWTSGNCFSVSADGKLHTSNCSSKKNFVCQLTQRSLSNNDEPVCGKSVYYEAPMRKSRIKRRTSRIPASRQNETNNRLSIAAIFGGEEFITIDESPWIVRIMSEVVFNHHFVCTGVLIGPNRVLTSGKCMIHKEDVNMVSHKVFVGLGTEERKQFFGRIEPVHMVKIHDSYTKNMFIRGNIAILELKKKEPLDCWNVRQACLPKPETVNFSGLKCVVYSWGGEGALKSCQVDTQGLTVREDDGLLLYQHHMYPCRLGEWDSGAPMLCMSETSIDKEWTLYGIFSNSLGRYAAFTYVPEHHNWIHGETTESHAVTCFHEELDISCDHGRPPLINVHQATYGVTNTERCPWQTPKQLSCVKAVTSLVRDRLCAAKNRCHFNVTTELFGDPCPGHFEYLEISYTCIPIPENSYLEWTVCREHDELEVTCGESNPLVIKVLGAVFAKSPQSGRCPDLPEGGATCSGRDVTAELADRQQIRPRKVNKQEGETLRLAATVPTLETTAVTSPNETGVPSATPATPESVSNNGSGQPIRGKFTYANRTSVSDNALWSEANGKGVTTAVKIPGKSANDSGSRKSRSLTRHKSRRGNLRDHWSLLSNRSSSSKRKMRWKGDLLVSRLLPGLGRSVRWLQQAP